MNTGWRLRRTYRSTARRSSTRCGWRTGEDRNSSRRSEAPGTPCVTNQRSDRWKGLRRRRCRSRRHRPSCKLPTRVACPGSRRRTRPRTTAGGCTPTVRQRSVTAPSRRRRFASRPGARFPTAWSSSGRFAPCRPFATAAPHGSSTRTPRPTRPRATSESSRWRCARRAKNGTTSRSSSRTRRRVKYGPTPSSRSNASSPSPVCSATFGRTFSTSVPCRISSPAPALPKTLTPSEIRAGGELCFFSAPA